MIFLQSYPDAEGKSFILFFFSNSVKVPVKLDPVLKTDVMWLQRYQTVVSESGSSHEMTS